MKLNIATAREMYASADHLLRRFALDNYPESELAAPPRPTAEQRLIELWCGCTPHLDPEYPDSVFWMDVDGNMRFEQDFKNGDLFCRYETVWRIFQSGYGLQFTEIQALVKRVMEERLKQKVLTPYTGAGGIEMEMEERLKQKVLTPSAF